MAKQTSAKDIREKNDAEVNERLDAAKSELFKARFENYTNRLNDTAKVGKLRREIAQLNTVMSERRRAKKAPTAQKAKS
jgi:large subunit ribosomal protein L29